MSQPRRRVAELGVALFEHRDRSPQRVVGRKITIAQRAQARSLLAEALAEHPTIAADQSRLRGEPLGAKGWEWFELRERPSGDVGVVWRGVNALSGESYGGDPLGGCNGCHETSATNDFVMAQALTLR